VISIGPRSGDRTVRRGPRANRKWFYGSVIEPARSVIGRVFDHAGARDPLRVRTWVVLVDGDRHQFELIETEAARRSITIHIICDLIHVLEYLWRAGRCLHAPDDSAAESWVAGHALALLNGNLLQTLAALRDQADRLPGHSRDGIDAAVRYLTGHTAFLRYHQALAAGWPIATGVIEGTVRHIVGGPPGNHRCEMGPGRRRGRPQAPCPDRIR
jgi:hypothetical protein